jgi:ketosteroid isomerase-like protein
MEFDMDGIDGRIAAIVGKFIGAAILSVGVLASAQAESLSEKLKRQTQEFSDAGHTGNKAVIERYLDPKVVMVNEDGSVVGKKDIIDGAAPPPAGVTLAIKVTDWALRLHGDTAVATFVDILDENFHGQSLQYQYRSTEVWKRNRQEWQMISSQSLGVPIDPPAIQLAGAALEDYVGRYAVTPTNTLSITRQNEHLFAAIDQGSAVEIKAEFRDVFFTPGRAGRKVFQRDGQGQVIGYHVRLDGRDIAVKKQT